MVAERHPALTSLMPILQHCSSFPILTFFTSLHGYTLLLLRTGHQLFLVLDALCSCRHAVQQVT